jgi:hypothetical protein
MTRLSSAPLSVAKMEPDRAAQTTPQDGQKPQMRHDIGHFPPKQAMV